MAYATIAEADAVLGADWVAQTATQKQFHLDIGALLIDEQYTCPQTMPYDPNLVNANIILAEDSRVDQAGTAPVQGTLTKLRVKAGDVESEKQYADDGSTASQGSIDQVGLLLRSVCDAGGTYSTTFGTVRV